MSSQKNFAPFRGAATALCTPFCEGGVDYTALGEMLTFQIERGIDALVLCGTTGEAGALDEREYEDVLAFSCAHIASRVPFIAGCGAECTAAAAARAKIARRHGADALLLVTPYYCKGTREGIRRHFYTVAEAAGLPVILYHIPGRTGVRLSAEEIARIAEHPLICGVKEASGDMELFATLAAGCGERLALYTGNDALLLPALSLGGAGVISVISNLLPAELSDICHRFFGGDTVGAARAHLRLLPLIQLLFRETNPAPLKWAMALRGHCRPDLRLPMAEVEAPLKEALAAELRRLGEE